MFVVKARQVEVMGKSRVGCYPAVIDGAASEYDWPKGSV